jgi:hypothetical protein
MRRGDFMAMLIHHAAGEVAENYGCIADQAAAK